MVCVMGLPDAIQTWVSKYLGFDYSWNHGPPLGSVFQA